MEEEEVKPTVEHTFVSNHTSGQLTNSGVYFSTSSPLGLGLAAREQGDRVPITCSSV